MPVNPTVLLSELQNDPANLGYAPLVAIRNDAGLAQIINFVRDGVTACPVNSVVGASITVNRPDCTPDEVLEAIDIRDFPATPGQVNNIPLTQSWLESITQFPRIKLANPDGSLTLVRRNLNRMVNDNNGSQSRLDAVAVRRGSRSEQLFGVNTAVTVAEVSSVLN